MKNLPAPRDPEPKAIRLLDGMAPRMRHALPYICLGMAELGWSCSFRETLRLQDRQTWLWECGRIHNGGDNRGIVTSVRDVFTGWHVFGLACDLVSTRYGDNAPDAFYLALEQIASRYNCRTGLRFKNIPGGDGKHVQWAPCRVSPSWRAKALYLAGGNVAVWKAVGAN